MLRALLPILLLAAAQPGGSSAQSAGHGLAVTPLLIEHAPGDVWIENVDVAPARLMVSLQDFDQGPDGSNEILPLGASGQSCGSRTRISEVPSILLPGQRFQVHVEVAAGPVCWGVLLVEASKDAGRGNRVAVKFFHVPDGSTRGLEITAMEVVQGPQRRVRVAVRSTGSAPIRPFGTLEFRTDSGRVIAAVDVPDFGLHPGADRFVVVPVPEPLPAGRYVVLAVLDAGAPDYIAAQTVLDLPPAP